MGSASFAGLELPRSSSEPSAASIHVLLVCDDPATEAHFRERLGGVTLRTVGSINETEGIGTDLVVIADDFPMSELAALQVHPQLSAVPAIVFAPGRSLRAFNDPTGQVAVLTTSTDPIGTLAEMINAQ